MNIEKIQKSLYWAVIFAETSHVFCCVLPTIFSILSLMVGLGMVAAMPTGFVVLHDILHHWELPLILLSGGIIMAGWGVHLLAKKLDCHNTGCVHEPCTPKKKRAARFLTIATVLFVINVGVYTVFHKGMDIGPSTVHQNH